MIELSMKRRGRKTADKQQNRENAEIIKCTH